MGGERVGSAVSRTQSGRSFREFSDADDDDDQGFRDKLAQRNAANTDYFQGKRSTDVVHKIAQREAELANQLEDKLKRFIGGLSNPHDHSNFCKRTPRHHLIGARAAGARLWSLELCRWSTWPTTDRSCALRAMASSATVLRAGNEWQNALKLSNAN